MLNRKNGFTLVELMIVVAIISVIAAISVPMLVRSRVQAREVQVIAFMHSYHAAQIQFHTALKKDKNKDGNGDFGLMKDLISGTPEEIAFIEGTDRATIQGNRDGILYGYRFNSRVWNGNRRREPAYHLRARPAKRRHGGRGFFIDDSGVIRYNVNGKFPNEKSPAL